MRLWVCIVDTPTTTFIIPKKKMGMRNPWVLTSPSTWVSANYPPFMYVNGESRRHGKPHHGRLISCATAPIRGRGRTTGPRRCDNPLCHSRKPLEGDTTLPTTICYLYDFISPIQGGAAERMHMLKNIFHTIDHVFYPNSPSDEKCKETIYLKKLRKGDVYWLKYKTIRGLDIDM